MPRDWVLFEGVQILSSSWQDPLVDLNTLQPLARSQVVLQGGLRLPGHLRKWLRDRPPELRVSSDEGSELRASLTCTRPLTRPTPPDGKREGAGSALIWDLAELSLPDGDYGIEIRSDGKLIGSELLRLRSADNPTLRVDGGIEPIMHDAACAGFGLLARRSSSPAAFEGAADQAGTLFDGVPPSIPGWWTARSATIRSSAARQVITFPKDGPSCIETGAHYMDLPMGLEGTSIEGICRHCGLVKRYPTKYHLSKKKAKALAAPVIRLGELPLVQHGGGRHRLGRGLRCSLPRRCRADLRFRPDHLAD